MSHSNYFTKSQNQENSKRVIDFYHEVLKEFTNKLDKEFRYKGIITTQQIQQMELVRLSKIQIVNQRLGQPLVLFEKTLKMKQGTKTEQEIKNEIAANREPELKEEYDEDNIEYKRGDEINNKEPKDSDQDEDDEFDDADDFYKHINNKNDLPFQFKHSKSEGEVKKEDNDNIYIQRKPAESEKQIKQQEQESGNSSDSDKLPAQQCLQNLSSIILSTFNAPTLKHKPKQQKITVNLDNTFLKSVYNQIYIGSVTVDINKIEKSEVRRKWYQDK